MGLALGNGIGLSHGPGLLPYLARLLAVDSANLLAYWPLSEGSGTTAVNAGLDTDYDGAYSSDVSGWPPANGIGDGLTAPTFDGDDYVNIYTSAFNLNFDRDAGTMAAWAKVSGSGVWSDAANRFILSVFSDGNNYVRIHKSTTSNNMRFRHEGTNVLKTVDHTMSPTGWFHVAMTWDETADEFKAYVNGSQVGSTQTSLGAFVAGPLDNTRCAIGVLDIDAPIADPWDGFLAHAAVWTVALSAAKIAQLARV